MADDDLVNRLRELGERSAPPVDGAFANRLETDLRAQHESPAPRGFRLPDMLLRPATVLAALALVLGVAAVLRLGADDPTVAIVAADGTTVSIPGEANTEAGLAGLDLPEGTRIEVAQGGSAVVAGVVLEAGSTALVVDGRIEVVESPAVTAVEPPPTTVDPPVTTTTAEPDAPRTTGASSSLAPTTTRKVPGPTVTTAPPDSAPSTTDEVEPPPTTEPPRTTVPATTVPVDPTPTTRPAITVAPVPTTTVDVATTEGPVVDKPVEPIVTLDIGAVRNGLATLTWTVDGPTDEIRGWAVRLVRGDSNQTIAVLRVAEARRLRVEVPDGRVAYRVVAWSDSDELVARSRLVSPGA